jgi:hypothetical protein
VRESSAAFRGLTAASFFLAAVLFLSVGHIFVLEQPVLPLSWIALIVIGALAAWLIVNVTVLIVWGRRGLWVLVGAPFAVVPLLLPVAAISNCILRNICL